MVFFRKLFILQLVGLALTYNFSNCDFKQILDSYKNIISCDLKAFVKGNKSKVNRIKSCYTLSECLTTIEHHTFNPDRGCPTLSKEKFALHTNITLSKYCEGYSGAQINTTEEVMQRKVDSNCKNQASRIEEWWRRLMRISGY